MADIQFTGDIVINTKEAEKSIANLHNQIKSVYFETGKMMNAALLSSNFGFGATTLSYSSALDETKKLLKEHEKAIKKMPHGKKASKGQLAEYKKALKDASEASQYLKAVGSLNTVMGSLSPYDSLYSDIDSLRNAVLTGKYTPKTTLGKGDVLGRLAGGMLGKFYRYSIKYPGIFTRDVLELGEGSRDTNRDSTNKARAEWRFQTSKVYRENAAAAAIDYILDTSNSLDAISQAYGVSFTRTKKALPKNLNDKYIENMSAFLDAIDNIETRKQRLDSGNLSKAQRSVEFKWLQKDLTDLTRVGRALGGEAKKASLAIKESNDLYIANKKSLYGGEIWRAIGGGSLLAGALHSGEQMLQSYWGESITRSIYGSKQAYYKRWEVGGGLAGGTVGALAGAALGSFAPGIGNAVGAAVGGVLGNTLGSLYGAFKGVMTQSDIKSTDSMIARIRNRAMFGSAYNTYFANAMSRVTGGDGMAELANQSMSLRARMMLGQVSEYDMLYYSMMPNYFAALMNGVTGPQLAKIYQSDLGAIGDPSMRYVVGQAIGGGNAFAMANNPYFNALYAGFVGRAGQYESAASRMSTDYMSGLAWTTVRDIGKDFTELYKTRERGDTDFYISPVTRDNTLRRWRSGFLQPGDVSVGVRDRGEGITFINVINLDGNEIKKDIKTADEIYIDSWSQYAGG